MPLTCELGFHRPHPIARWNDGYYFSKCTRCGRDLVRTAYEGWRVPKGYKVVWQPDPPAERISAALVADQPPAKEQANSTEEAVPENAALVETEESAPDAGKTEAVASAAEVQEELVFEGAGQEHLSQGSATNSAAPDAPSDELAIMAVLRDLHGREGAEELEANGSSGDQNTIGESDAEPDSAAEAIEPSVVAADDGVTAEAGSGEPLIGHSEASETVIKRSIIDDFMIEESAARRLTTAGVSTPAPRPPATQPAGGPQPVRDRLDHSDADDDWDDSPADLPQFHHELPAWDEPHVEPSREPALSFSDDDEAVETAESGAGAARSGRRLDLRIAIPAAAAVAILALSITSGGRGTQPKKEAAPAVSRPAVPVAAPARSPDRQPQLQKATPSPAPQQRPRAYVAASVLQCRASPVKEARSLKKLSRGAPVEILAKESDWVSISHRGRQCWVAARYISPDQPL